MKVRNKENELTQVRVKYLREYGQEDYQKQQVKKIIEMQSKGSSDTYISPEVKKRY